MPTGTSVVSPHLRRLAVQIGANQTGFSYTAIPSTPAADGSRDGSYETYGAGTFLLPSEPTAIETGIRAVKGPYLSFDAGITPSTYTLEEYYSYYEADPGEFETGNGAMHWRKMVNATGKRYKSIREFGTKTALFTTGNWSNGAIGAPNKFNVATSNPPKTIRERWAAIQLSAAAGDGAERHMWMNQIALNHLLAHPIFTREMDDGEVTSFGTRQMVADAFDMKPENIHVPTAVYNSARKGQTPVNAYIWSDDYLWMGYLPKSISEGEQTALAYIHLGSPDPTVMRGSEDTGRKKYDWVRQASVGKNHVVDTSAAYLYTDIY
jgi:hypothetical protein